MDLKFDTGLIELDINCDPTRKLRFNPTDGRLVEGFLQLVANAETKLKEFNAKEELLNARIEQMEELEAAKERSALERETDAFLRGEMDAIFGAGSSEMIFWEASSTALASNGDYVFMNFLMAIFPYFESEIKTRNRKVADIVRDHKPKQKVAKRAE